MAHSPHRRFKGCCLMCAMNAEQVRGAGRRKYPARVARQLGRKRRFNKRVGADD